MITKHAEDPTICLSVKLHVLFICMVLFPLGSTYLPVQWVHLPSFSVGPSTFLLNGSIYFPIQGTPEKARRAIKYIPASSGEWRLNSTPPPPRAVTSCTARASRSRNQTTQQTNLTKKIKRRRGSHITSS